MAQGIITEIGRKKLCMAHSGDITLPPIVQMGFGSGGIDSSENVIEPTGTEKAMVTELLRKNIDSHCHIPTEQATCRYTVKLHRTELAGKQISEQALFDAEGDMVAYKTFLAKGKDEDMEFVFDMDEIF